MSATAPAPTIEHAPVGLLFWVKWVLASTLAWTVTFLLTFVIFTSLGQLLAGDPEQFFTSPIAFGFVLALIFTLSGAALGYVQGRLIRQWVEQWKWWAGASALGFLVIATLFVMLQGIVSERVNELVHSSAGGAVIGFFQWQLLRRRFRGAGWWIPAAVVAMVTAGIAAFLVGQATGGNEAITTTAGIATMSALMGLLLVWLIRHPLPYRSTIPASGHSA